MIRIRTIALLALTCLPLAAVAEDSVPAGPDLTELIQRFAKRTGKKFVVDPRVRGIPAVAGIDPDRLTYTQLLSILNVNMFATVEQGDLVLVVPDANARQLPTPVYTDANFKALDDEIVTLLLTPKNACAIHMVPVLRPLMPQAAHMAAAMQSNTLIIADRAVNVRRVAQIIERLDRAAPAGAGCDDFVVKRKE